MTWQLIPRAQRSGLLMFSQRLRPRGTRGPMTMPRGPTFLLVMYFPRPVHRSLHRLRSSLRQQSLHHHPHTQILTLQPMISPRRTISTGPLKMYSGRMQSTLLLVMFSLKLSLTLAQVPSSQTMSRTFRRATSVRQLTFLLRMCFRCLIPRFCLEMCSLWIVTQSLTVTLIHLTSSHCRVSPIYLHCSSVFLNPVRGVTQWSASALHRQ